MSLVAPPYRVVSAGRGWDWLVEGFQLFKRQPGVWVGIIILWAVLAVVMTTSTILAPLLGLIGSILLGGLMWGCAELRRGGELEIGHLFAGFKARFLSLLLLGVANLVANVAIGIVAAILALTFGLGSLLGGLTSGALGGGGVGTAVGLASFGLSLFLVLLVVLGLYLVVLLAMIMSPALVSLGGLEPWPALQASLLGAWDNWRAFTVFGLIHLLLCVVAAIPLLLGFLVLLPVSIGAIYTAYRDIFPELAEQVQPAA